MALIDSFGSDYFEFARSDVLVITVGGGQPTANRSGVARRLIAAILY
jgi:hypothetical protein